MNIPTPLEKETAIEWPGAGEFTVVFRQAVGGDDDKLVAYEREVMKGHWVELSDGTRYYKDEIWEPEKMAPERVRLTLVSCDLEDKGKPVFESGMNRTAFAKAWAMVPSTVRNSMHAACLEVNPDWTPFWMRKNEEPDSEK